MTSNGNAPRSESDVSAILGIVAFLSTGLFVVLLLLLHVFKPELDPSWHFISEYQIGAYGWLMQSAFLSLAIGNVALFVAIRKYLRGIWGRIGSFLFLVGAIGLVLAGIFVTDPLNTASDAVTTSGRLHNLGGTLGLAGFLGTLILSWKLISKASATVRDFENQCGQTAT